MLDINTSPITLKTIIDEDGSFSITITLSMAFSSPEKFRWEINFGQGSSHRGVIAFKAGESGSQSIPQSIDPDEHYQFRIYRVSDNGADDELVFQQQSEPLPLKDAPQRAEVEGAQGAITQVNAVLVLNTGEETVINQANLLVSSTNQSDPALLVYTITVLPTEGTLLKDGVAIGVSETFTQADVNNGLIIYQPEANAGSDTFSFTVSDGTETTGAETLQITPRVVVDVPNPEEDNTIDQFAKTDPQQIEAGDGNDTITSGLGDDQIDGGAGDDDITLTHDGEDGSTNEVVYTFGYDGVGIDGGDVIKGFKLGQDKLKFVARPNSKISNLTEFLNSIKGADDTDLTDDDAFIVTMMWSLNEADAFSFDGVLLHFKEGTSFGGGRLSSPVVQITFDTPLDLNGLVSILGGAGSVADNFDGGLTAFKNLAVVLPLLFGAGNITFEAEQTFMITSADRGLYIQKANGEEQIVYQTIVETDVEGTTITYSLKSGGSNDLFTINSAGEVRFKSGSVPVFDTNASFEITIIAQDLSSSVEKVITIYNNTNSVVSPAIKFGQSNTDSPAGRALGDTIGPDEPTDDDGVTNIDYYWFADNRPYSGSRTQTGLESLINGESTDSRGAPLTPLAGENDRLLTLKGEHAEKEIWLVVVITDGDDQVSYHFWAAEPDGRYDIADTRANAFDLIDIGISNKDNNGNLEFAGYIRDRDRDRDNDIDSARDNDWIIFAVEEGDSVTVTVDAPSGIDSAIIDENGSPESRTITEAGRYFLRISHASNTGSYRVTFEGIDDKPTDLQLTELVEIFLDADLSQGIKAGVLTIADDLYGSNTIILTGPDAELFEIRDTSDRLIKELWLKPNIDRSTLERTIEVIASVEGTGKGSNPDVNLIINVAGVERIPIQITGDRDTAGLTETGAIFVLGENGRLTLADGTDAGVITTVDDKTVSDQFTFTILGEHSDLFEVVLLDHDQDANTPDAWVLRLKDPAAALPSGSDYTITIVATDAASVEFRRDLRIEQGGLYIYDFAGADDGLSRVFSDGKALIQEEEDGSVVPVTIGALRNEFTSNPDIEVLGFELVDGEANNDQFMIERGDGADGMARTDDDVFVLKFIGSDSGDADIATDDDGVADVLNVKIRETYIGEKIHEETVDEDGAGSFVGTKDIDASGDTTDDDTRVFALSGGGLNARDFIYQDLLDAGETSESLSSSEERKASIFTGTLDFSNVAIAVQFEGTVVGDRFGFNIDVFFPEDFKSGDTIWIRFGDNRHDSVRGVEVVIRISGDGTSLIFTPTGAVKVVEVSLENYQISTEDAYRIDFDNPELTDIPGVTFTAGSDTFTSNSWHISHVFVDGVEVVASRLLDNIDRKVKLDNTNYDATVNATLSIVADEGGPAGNTIRVVVEIGTAANPTTGEKGIESVSVVDDVITVVTYSEGATWQNVADAINDDTNAGALVDVVATLATAEDDAEAVDLYLSGGENIPPLEENTNARLIDVEGGWIYPDDASAIRFEAKIDLRLDLSTGEAEVIVVPTDDVDGNGVRIGEVRLLTSDETPPDEYYVIGTTGVLSNDMDSSAMAEAVLEIEGKEYLKFTSVEAGTLGNGQKIQVVFSDKFNTSQTFFANDSGVIKITINRSSTRPRFERDFPTIGHVTQLVDFEFIGEFEDAGFFNDPAFAYLFDGRTITLTLDIGRSRIQTDPTPATGTEVTTPEVLTRQGEITKTHDYQINLDNIDDNAPVFGEAVGFEVTVPSDGSDPHGEASIDENDTDPGVIFQVSASDADGDVVTYSLADDFGLFEIDAATGEITLITGESADFEAAASYDLQVIATSIFEGEAPKTTNFKVVVQVNDVAETGGAASNHILIGGEDAQTLNASDRGDVIFGGQGDDTINLGAGRDTVIYRYDATDKTNPAAIDGGDVINDFDLDEDALVLTDVGGNVYDEAAAFYAAIKGVHLLVDGDGRISGIVFTFTGRVNEAQDTDLTVNFDEGFDASQINLDASFDAAASGERVITTGQETAAYQAINQVLGESLALIDFADVGFELNAGDTDIL